MNTDPYAQRYTEAEIADLWETHAMDNPDCATCRWLATITDLGAPGGATDPARMARALRKTYPEHLRRSNDDQMLGDARFLLAALAAEGSAT